MHKYLASFKGKDSKEIFSLTIEANSRGAAYGQAYDWANRSGLVVTSLTDVIPDDEILV